MFKLFESGNLASNSLLKGVNKHDCMVLKFYQFWLQYLEIKVLKCLKDVFRKVVYLFTMQSTDSFLIT